MGVNFRTPFFLTQSLLPYLAEGGRVVMISSVAARLAYPSECVYALSKAALEALVRQLAPLLGPRQITVNAVAPGFILPPPEGFEPHREAELLGRIPLARSGTEDDIVEAVLYLARASYVTGQVLAVDGGRTLTLG